MTTFRYATAIATAAFALLFTAVPAPAQFGTGGNSSGRPAFAHYPPLPPTSAYHLDPVVRTRPVGDQRPGIFMTSINYPGVYGAHTIGVTPASFNVAPKLSWQSYEPRPTLTRRTGDDAPLGYLPATIRVLAPVDAEVFFQDEKAIGTDVVREWTVPPMSPDHPARFEVRVRWQEGGQMVGRREMVRVHGGETVVVDFGGSRSSYSSNGQTNELRTAPIPPALPRP